MKKRFVAKQVGVLSLTAVLAGMPAVNVLAEDVYAQKVESLQKEMLEQAVATETKLNITFETVHGEKVGETVAKTTATGTGDWTFMLGTDYQLPEGYQLATGVEQVTNVAVPFGATAGHTVVVEPVAGAVTETKLNVTFETVHGEKVGETVASTTAAGTGDWTFMLGTDYQLPEGYQLATGVEQVTNVAVPFGATAGHTVVVEPVAGAVTETKLNITFETVHGEKVGETVAKTTATGTGDWTFMLGTDYQLPEGYQLATGVEQVTNVAVPFGATAGHTVVVEPVAGAVTETKLNITFETVHGEKVGETVAKTTATGTGDWTFMLGTDYQLPEGYQLATGVEQVTNVAVPFGATAGHTVVVEPVQEAVRPTVLTVAFETVYGEKVGETVASTTATGTGDWTFMLGTDYQLPAGYQLAAGVDQVTNIQVPFGATAGHTAVVEPVPGEVVETKLNVTFETVYGEKVGEAEAKTTATGADGEAWTFMLGTDFNLPEGWQLAAGVEQVTNIQVPFGATAGHTVVVEPVAGEVVETKLNVTFETVDGEKVGEAEAKTTATGADGEAWTFMLGTDFNLPEGYKLAEGVEQVTNIQVPFGATAGHTMIVEKNTETPDKPDLENPEKPDSENPEKPNPENPEKPNQDNTNKDDGKTQNTDKKTENKAKTPKTGDDLQAAGTFSILGAGALAAIAALLKKRK